MCTCRLLSKLRFLCVCASSRMNLPKLGFGCYLEIMNVIIKLLIPNLLQAYQSSIHICECVWMWIVLPMWYMCVHTTNVKIWVLKLEEDYVQWFITMFVITGTEEQNYSCDYMIPKFEAYILMHMTSQKGAPACWVSNEALSSAPSPSMKPAGQPLHAIPPSRPGPAHWLRGWERQRSSSTTRARSATSLDPQHGVVVMETWRQCIRSIYIYIYSN